MSSYDGGVMLGFAAVVTRSMLPDWILRNFSARPCPTFEDGSAAIAPCGMRKVEAALLDAGFSREEVMVAHPDHLDERPSARRQRSWG